MNKHIICILIVSILGVCCTKTTSTTNRAATDMLAGDELARAIVKSGLGTDAGVVDACEESGCGELGKSWHDDYVDGNCDACPECCVYEDADEDMEEDYAYDEGLGYLRYCVNEDKSLNECWDELNVATGRKSEAKDQFICSVAVTLILPDSGLSYARKVARKKLPTKFDLCIELMEAAREMGEEQTLVAAIAIEESGISLNVVSSAGAVGPLQILPKYHCPYKTRKSCDLIFDGIEAIAKFRRKYGGPTHKDQFNVLCHYNGGNRCGKKAKAYAKRVLRDKLILDTALKFWKER